MAAENRARPDWQAPGRYASMRPRRMAAENTSRAVVVTSSRLASMRPRRMAAENQRTGRNGW